jgi:hypothetical protein
MRRDDLGDEGEQFAAVDALVFGHLRPLRSHSKSECEVSSKATTFGPQAPEATDR